MEIETQHEDQDFDIFAGEDLSDDEIIEMSVEWLRFKKVAVWDELEIPIGLVDDAGRTLLMHAAHDGDYEKVLFCIEHRLSDPNSRCFNNYNALAYATKMGHDHIADYLQQIGLTLANTGNFSRLNSNPDLNLEGFIAGYFKGDVVKMLDHYIKTYIEDINGHFSIESVYRETLLSVACSELSVRCTQCLIESGASLTQGSESDGMSPIENVLTALSASIPPTCEDDWVNIDNGIQILTMLIELIQDYGPYVTRLARIVEVLSSFEPAPRQVMQQNVYKNIVPFVSFLTSMIGPVLSEHTVN